MAKNDLSESKMTNMDPVMELLFTKMIPCPRVGILKMIPCSAARPPIEKYMSTSPGASLHQCSPDCPSIYKKFLLPVLYTLPNTRGEAIVSSKKHCLILLLSNKRPLF